MTKFNNKKKKAKGYYFDREKRKGWRLRHYVGYSWRKGQSVFLSKSVSTEAEAKKMVEDKWYKDDHRYQQMHFFFWEIIV